MSCLKQLQRINSAPWPVVLTTSQASLGHDLTTAAFVIQTELPGAWSIFVQNAGRSNRGDVTVPLVGALVTKLLVFDIDSVKQGCEY